MAARDMLLRTSLADLSMDELARAADVSRGTLYRVFPGKAALLNGLIVEYSPFDSVRAIVSAHHSEPPEIVLPLIAREVAGRAGEQIGLLRAIFLEVTSGSEPALSGVSPLFAAALGELADYLAGQMAAGRVRLMDPVLALQAFIGPILFHLMTRATIAHIGAMPLPLEQAIAELVRVSTAGLASE